MGVWVQTGPDSYLPYGLSGGPWGGWISAEYLQL